jgi:hypothetical protein
MSDILDEAQGWYLDPYERHEQRWFSAGNPTALVRDSGVEGHDAPPASPPPKPLTPASEADVPAADAYDAADASQRAFRAAFGNIAT